MPWPMTQRQLALGMITASQGGYASRNCLASLSAVADVLDKDTVETIARTLTLHMANLLAQTAASIEANAMQINASLQQLASNNAQLVADVVQPNNSPRIQRVSNAPTTKIANNPTSKLVLQARSRTHLQTTRANTPGASPKITQAPIVPPTPSVVTLWRSNRLALRN